MAKYEVDDWNWFVEVCCKLYLWLIGSVLIMSGLVLWFGDSFIRSHFLSADWLAVYLLWVGTFAWVLYWYLWRTDGGTRLLVRILNLRTRAAKIR